MNNYKDLLNGASMWGLILGLILSISKIIELRGVMSGDVEQFYLLAIEWFVVAVVTIYTLYRANRKRAASMPAELGYRFVNTLNYTVLISIFAGAIVGLSSHIYIVNVIGGYDVYASESLVSLTSLYSDFGLEESIAPYLAQIEATIPEMRSNPPSILSSLLSSVSNYIFVGFIVGVLISFFVKRKPEALNSVK